jgi:hypothetical protein
VEFDRVLAALFAADEAQPCPACAALLRHFAEVRPVDLIFLRRQDLVDLHSPSFAGIPEWEAFAAHYSRCESCNA